MPRWLVWLLIGIAAGASGVVFVQERYLPPRLSAAESARLRNDFQQADGERARLQAELTRQTQRLDAATLEKKTLTDELAASRQTAERLRADVAAMVESFPPDPRGGAVEVRAARFTKEGGSLAYDVVLSRDRAGTRALTGVIQMMVGGEAANGSATTVALKPVEIAVTNYQSLRGSLPLPEGFNPRQTTIHVRDRVDGKLLGMRVMYVK